MTEQRRITVELRQTNLQHVRLVANYSMDGQVVASKTQTIKIPDQRQMDFDLCESAVRLLQESLWFWANQLAIPGI